MTDSPSVLIVGAGPTGLTAANELTAFGIPVRIVDGLEQAATTSRALAVQARTLELLERDGLTARMVARGNRAKAASIYGDDKPIGRIDLSAIPSRYDFILLLPQNETERLMAEHLAAKGVQVERGIKVVAIAQREKPGVTAVLELPDGKLESIHVDFLIAADGAHSLVRHTLDLSFAGKSHTQNYALADLHADGDLPEDELSLFISRAGFMGIFPIGDRRFRLIAGEPASHAMGTGDPQLPELQRLYDAAASIPAKLRDLVWSSRFRVNSRMVEKLRVGSIFLGGDAAHVHSPAGGQGMNTGIQDMIDLSWKLAMVSRGIAAPELLDTYQEDRLPIIRNVVMKTESATDAFVSGNPFVHDLVTHLGPMLMGMKAVTRGGARTVSQTAVNYRSSSLSTTGDARGRVAGGDRVPYLDVAVAGAGSASLYTVLDRSLFTILVTGNAGTDAVTNAVAPWNEIVKISAIAPADNDAEFTAAFGDGSSLMLVRPDAYFAFVGGSYDLAELTAWLERWFPAKVGATSAGAPR